MTTTTNKTTLRRMATKAIKAAPSVSIEQAEELAKWALSQPPVVKEKAPVSSGNWSVKVYGPKGNGNNVD